MKIAILSVHYPPKWIGGEELATRYIAEGLAAQGHEIHVVTSYDKHFSNQSAENGVTVHRIVYDTPRLVRDYHFQARALLALSALRPDIVIIEMFYICICGLLVKKLLKTPYIICGHGSDVYLPATWDQRLTRKLRAAALEAADAITALGPAMQARIRQLWSVESTIIPNGVHPARFAQLNRYEARDLIGVKDNGAIIIYIGALRSIKGVEYLLKAMKTITERDPTVSLLIIGEGVERQKLEGLARNLGLEGAVQFIGRVANEDIPHYLSASDLFVLPSLSEAFGIALLEAMASGLPIVATNVGDISSFVENAVNGFLVEPGRASEIAEKVLLLLQDRRLCDHMAQNNLSKAKLYSWDVAVRKVEVLLNVLTAPTRQLKQRHTENS
jgi:glycosyltransferase involved in cell wall biosynthesis